MNAAEFETVFDALIDAAFEVLLDRERVAPVNRLAVVAGLHATHDVAAYELLVADVEHSGEVTLTAAGLAALLEPPVPDEPSPSASYVAAEARRRAHAVDEPAGWLDAETRARCIAHAREAIARAKADRAAVELAAKDAVTAANGTPKSADGGSG